MSKITEFGIKSALKCFKKAKRNKDFFEVILEYYTTKNLV